MRNREVTELSRERARKFLVKLAEEPFFAVVITDDEVQIFSKDLDAAHMDRIRKVLAETREEG